MGEKTPQVTGAEQAKAAWKGLEALPSEGEQALLAANKSLNEVCEGLPLKEDKWETTLADGRTVRVEKRKADPKREKYNAAAGWDVSIKDKNGNRISFCTNYVEPSTSEKLPIVWGQVTTRAGEELNKQQVLEILDKLGVPEEAVNLGAAYNKRPMFISVRNPDWATSLVKETPPIQIRTLYENFNKDSRVKEWDRLEQHEAWREEPETTRFDLVDLLRQTRAAEAKVRPLRTPIDEQNKDRYPRALGIPRAQLEDLTTRHRWAEEAYGSLRYCLFGWERAIAPSGPRLGTTETDVLKALERFNEVITGEIPDYKAKDPSEVIAVLRSELVAPAEAPPPSEAKPSVEEVKPPEEAPAVKEAPKTPEEKVKARIEAVNEAAKEGKGAKLEKTDYLIEFLKSKGISEKDIMRRGASWCWRKAAEFEGLELKKAPRPEPRELVELREEMGKLRGDMQEMRERLTKLEEELTTVKSKNEKLKADQDLLLKALRGEELSDEEKERVSELKGETPPVAPEEVEVEEEVVPTAVDKALDELLGRYAPQEKIAGKGRVRGALLPILGGIGGGRVAEFAAATLERLGKIPIPGLAAFSAGLSSLGASAIRRVVGENSFSLWARYSHTEGGKGKFLGKIVKFGQMFGRGVERVALRRILSLTGSDEVRRLLALYDEQGKLSIPENLGNQMYVEGLIREGMWYGLGTEAAKLLGAYYTPEEIKEIETNRPKVLQAIRGLYNSEYVPPDQREAVLKRIQDGLISREKMIYLTEATALAGIGAGKAALLSGAVSFVGEHLIPRVSEYLKPGVEKIVKEVRGREMPPVREVPPVLEIPKIPEKAKELIVHRTVGHTYVANGRPTGWENLELWQGRLLANDAENPEFWRNASRMVEAIVGNPDKALAGLEPATYKSALEAARATKEALEAAGYNPATNTLTNSEAVLGNLQMVKDLFHWVYEGQKIIEPI